MIAIPFLVVGCSVFSGDGDDPSLAGEEDADDPPVIRLGRDSVEGGSVSVGQSYQTNVAVWNDGGSDLVLDVVEVTGAGSASWYVLELEGDTIHPDQKLPVTVVFEPASGGDQDAALTVLSNDPVNSLIEASLYGVGIPGEIAAIPTSLDFGDVTLETVAEPQSVLISNSGSGALTLTSIGTTGAGGFELAEGGDLSSGSVLQPGDSGTVYVTFAPQTEGCKEGALSIENDDEDEGDLEIPLTACGARPVRYFDVDLLITADSRWEGWMDGDSISARNSNSWSTSDTVNWTLENGDHVLAIHASDSDGQVAGLLAVLYRDDSVWTATGGETDPRWVFTTSNPGGASWREVGYDDSSWQPVHPCVDTGYWGSAHSGMRGDGAMWVWSNVDCRVGGELYVRVDLTLE